jgi:serine/threonine-protein kinase SRPK3
VIRRAEEDEARRKRREGAGGDASGGDMSPNSTLKAALDQSEADAMKPVDDIAALSDLDKVDSAPVPPHAYHPPKLSNAPVSSSSTAKENAARPLSSGSAGAATSSPRSRPTSSAKSTSASAKR